VQDLGGAPGRRQPQLQIETERRAQPVRDDEDAARLVERRDRGAQRFLREGRDGIADARGESVGRGAQGSDETVVARRG
jgi:hypothetical protein